MVLNNRAILGRKSTYVKKFKSKSDFDQMLQILQWDQMVWAKKKINQKYLRYDENHPFEVNPFPASKYPDVQVAIKTNEGEVLAHAIEVK